MTAPIPERVTDADGDVWERADLYRHESTGHLATRDEIADKWGLAPEQEDQ